MTQAPSAPPAARLLRELAAELAQVQDADLALATLLRRGLDLLEAQAGIGVAGLEAGDRTNAVAVGLPEAARASLSESVRNLLADRPATADEGFVQEVRGEAGGRLQRAGLPHAMVLPIVQRGTLVGALAFLFDRPVALSDEQLAWASVLAAHAGTALASSRLAAEALRQAAELGAFHEATASLGEEAELPILLASILDRACILMTCPAGLIYLADKPDRPWRALATQGLKPGTEPEVLDLEPAPFAEAIRTMRPAWSYPSPEELGAYGLRTAHHPVGGILVVPLIWRQQVIGALELLGDANRKQFSDTDIRLGRWIAQQAANAAGIARLVEAERRQRSAAEALESASLVLSRELETDLVLDRILEEVMRAIPCDAANFQSIDGDHSRIIRARGYEQFALTPEILAAQKLSLAEFVDLRRMIAGETLVIADTTKDPLWVDRPGYEWLLAWAGAPVRYGETIFGFLNLDSSAVNAFDGSTIPRLRAFAAHAAAAIHTARQYDQQVREHQQLLSVYGIGREVAGSLDPTEILDRLLAGACRTAGAQGGVALRRRETAPGIWARLAWSPRDQAPSPWTGRPEVTTLAERAWSEGRVVVDAIQDAGESWVLWGLPIVAGERTLGAAVVWRTGMTTPASGTAEVLAAAGQQAGLALANAQRHADVERRLAELKLLQAVAGSIARSLHVETILRELADQLHTQLGYPAVHIYRHEGQNLILAHYSGPQPVVERLSTTRGISGRVARSGKASFVRDVRTDPEYVAGLVGTVSEIAVPIRLKDEVIGVLNVETSDPEQFESGTLELLEILADQVSVAVQNAALFEQVRGNVQTLEARVHERTTMLEEVVEQARAAEKVKAQFVADVSHELRTPLTNIGLYLDLLDIGAEDRRTDYMGTLRQEVDRLGTLIEQLLAISHLDTEKVELRRAPTSINTLVEMLAEERSRLLSNTGIDLLVEKGADLPLADIDPLYIMQAMTNIVSNAVNYTPAGGRVVLATARQAEKGKDWVTFSVADTGPGVPDSDRKRIFDRFYRGLVGKASGIAGTGLGLAIAKEIMNRHGGRISFRTQSGRGSTFTLWMPAATRPR